MSDQPQPLDPGTKRTAITLLRHLEWQPDTFSVLFLFADVEPARLGGTPESLDDLADSLLQVADLPGQRGTGLRDEARVIIERLAGRFPNVPRYQQRLKALVGQRSDQTGAGQSDTGGVPQPPPTK